MIVAGVVVFVLVASQVLIPSLGERRVEDRLTEADLMAIEGAVVTIDAIGCSVTSPRQSSIRRPITSSP